MRGSLKLALALWGAVFAFEEARACSLVGQITCPDGTPQANIPVIITGADWWVPGSSGSDGFYSVGLPLAAGNYQANLDLSSLGAGWSIVSPTPQPVAFTMFGITGEQATINWVIDGPDCHQEPVLACWLTGGGTKFSALAGRTVAEYGTKVNFGGNVNPSCSPEPGEGGQWTHTDHVLNLHFQGTAIQVDECGNAYPPAPPEGSESPVTPYNYIAFSGTGTLKGVQGNKSPETACCFEARAEDWNEPGSSGNRDGANVDRYRLRVYDCTSGATLMNWEGALTPVQITNGNLQLHVSSCEQ